MNLDKAIKKQNSYDSLFILFMCFIFCALPVVLVHSHVVNIFYIIYLVVIELLVILSILVRIKNNHLNHEYDGFKVKITDGIFKKNNNIVCEKVSLVHTEEDGKNMKIILITKFRFRNKYLRIVGKNFLKKYPDISSYYLKLKKLHPEDEYYYVIIRNGGYKKYILLNTLFKVCLQAKFTDECIEQLKKIKET
ncbi:hypothetical protein BJV85_001012 [Clostridium acetobutylicum]|uniref:Predicted membrane protein n=1 Tax=Clostridium acetobutylicum (strain ATCC 824 / DSM 792 / JCM 1419 / IAM 19013 / LMG 5710 / NBRC 13948 / NRRL B-527 / VKM B-1787 / 2291 / W) TaxID=272562 RepID=Q97F69_CLOAB|nr:MULTISPECIES: hypothetical protein [Clostridium]AAK80826.1 Predicted membrane protein [Clostridium acetobutylicum ATCC 824]ADZ21927.1 membrane protein [Clostridium acetobutylicum EA 2018]AEI32594.1 hypothetical protein SMB_G2919 [Clostridium acetobutylicum DSM 1731]AWV78762.1 hypothetical protein DK921_01265 [Clostridium acetobutylicum]MBC2393626.1 hypothetical protein [Clostridium acetobutylicum]